MLSGHFIAGNAIACENFQSALLQEETDEGVAIVAQARFARVGGNPGFASFTQATLAAFIFA